MYKRQVFANVDSWLWQDGSVDSLLTATNPGIIYVAVTNSCATEYDTLNISLLPPIPNLDLGPDTSICPGTSVSLPIGIPNVNILWSDGSSGASIIIADSTEVFATISNQCGQSIDSLSVFLLPETPVINLGPDQNICPGETFILTPDIPAVTYEWQDGSTLPSFETCLLYTSDAADERSSVDLGGRRIIKKKKKGDIDDDHSNNTNISNKHK